MTRPEKLQRLAAIFEAGEIRERAEAALRREFPDAPPAMVRSALFHVYTDGIDAALDWLLAAAEGLEEGGHLPDEGVTSHLLYHIYNWHQFRALLPVGSQELLDWLSGLEESIEQGDSRQAKSAVAAIKEIIEAGRQPPQLEP